MAKIIPKNKNAVALRIDNTPSEIFQLVISNNAKTKVKEYPKIYKKLFLLTLGSIILRNELISNV